MSTGSAERLPQYLFKARLLGAHLGQRAVQHPATGDHRDDGVRREVRDPLPRATPHDDEIGAVAGVEPAHDVAEARAASEVADTSVRSALHPNSSQMARSSASWPP